MEEKVSLAATLCVRAAPLIVLPGVGGSAMTTVGWGLLGAVVGCSSVAAGFSVADAGVASDPVADATASGALACSAVPPTVLDALSEGVIERYGISPVSSSLAQFVPELAAAGLSAPPAAPVSGASPDGALLANGSPPAGAAGL